MALPKLKLDAAFFIQLTMSFMTSVIIGCFAAAGCAVTIRKTVLYSLNLANLARAWTPGCWATLPGDKYVALFYVKDGNAVDAFECVPTEHAGAFILGFGVCCISLIMCYSILTASLKEHKTIPMLVVKQITFLLPAFGLWSMFYLAYFEKCVNTPRYFAAVDAVQHKIGKNGYEWMIPFQDRFMDNLTPPCTYVWMWWQRMAYWVGMISGALYAQHLGGDFKNIILHALAFITLFGFMMLMGQEFPKYYLPPYTDEDKVMVRLVYFTFAIEFISLFFRRSYNVGLGTAKLGFMFFSTAFGCMYGRILVSAVSDTSLLLLSSAGVGMVEIGSRLTAFQRDALLVKTANKLTGKGKLDALQSAEMQKRKAGLVVLETECEMGSIFYAMVFFMMVLSISGPLQYAKKPAYNRASFVKDYGFDVNKYLIRNTGIQVGIELLTDASSFLFEVYVIKINPWALVAEDGKGVFFRVYLCLFFFFFSMFFTSTLFYFPMVPGKAMSTTVGYDLDDTWIYVIPTAVDVSYMRAFTVDYFKKNPIVKDYDYGN